MFSRFYQEKRLFKEYVGITVDGYAFLSYSKMLFINVMVTNKRVAVSSNWFGVQSYKLPASMFYKDSDFEMANRLIRLHLYNIYKKDGFVYIKGKRKFFITKITWVIKDADLIYDTAVRYGVKPSKE